MPFSFNSPPAIFVPPSILNSSSHSSFVGRCHPFGELQKMLYEYKFIQQLLRYCLVAIVRFDLRIDRSIYEILQVLGISLLDKAPVKELFTNIDYKDVKELNYNQLSISLI